MPELTITSVACKAGIRPSTLRYYEKIGLLPSARRVAGRRRYDVCALKRLELIAYAKRAGFSLAQIQALQESASRGKPPALLWRDLAVGKADELDQIIFRAQEAKNRLATLSRCPLSTVYVTLTPWRWWRRSAMRTPYSSRTRCA